VPQSTWIEGSDVILIGEVVETGPALLRLRPEAFLKGPASGEELRFEGGLSGCPQPELATGDRALVFVLREAGTSVPGMAQTYVLRDGRAQRGDQPAVPEVQLVSEVREVTGQYIVIATSQDEGAGIDWGNTVVPLGVALAVIFGIGLVLMRVWHRIDPS
jgi:hypothetical protein